MRTVDVDGVPFAVFGPGDWLSDRLAEWGTWYEPAIVDTVSDLLVGLPPGDVVDVGAFLGTHVVPWATRAPQHTYHAVEPNPSAMPLLAANTARLANVRRHEYALADVPGTATLSIDPANAGHGSLRIPGTRNPGGREYAFVKVRRLDDMRLGRVHVIKVDVEGGEPAVIAGGLATIERDHPAIVIEDWDLAYGDILRPLGYRLAKSWPDHQTYLWR